MSYKDYIIEFYIIIILFIIVRSIVTILLEAIIYIIYTTFPKVKHFNNKQANYYT